MTRLEAADEADKHLVLLVAEDRQRATCLRKHVRAKMAQRIGSRAQQLGIGQDSAAADMCADDP